MQIFGTGLHIDLGELRLRIGFSIESTSDADDTGAHS
jgi:hypothetical protein